jgi:hypothetical protein
MTALAAQRAAAAHFRFRTDRLSKLMSTASNPLHKTSEAQSAIDPIGTVQSPRGERAPCDHITRA